MNLQQLPLTATLPDHPLPSLVLSLFPGIDLLGRGFELEGFTVVRGPDTIFGGDIAKFHTPTGRFDGIIGGPPCQDFSRKRRAPPTGAGVAMLQHFARVVAEARPLWWLMENVSSVPTVEIHGYRTQRLDLNARECGSPQNRPRHFQFGAAALGVWLVPQRSRVTPGPSEPCAMASEAGQKNRRTFADFCELQGLPRTFTLPAFTVAARYRAVGNGVHVAVARTLACAIKTALITARIGDLGLCRCGCGRSVTGRQFLATPACRKRMQRRRNDNGPDRLDRRVTA